MMTPLIIVALSYQILLSNPVMIVHFYFVLKWSNFAYDSISCINPFTVPNPIS